MLDEEMIRISIVLAAGLFAHSVMAESPTASPDLWEKAFGDERQQVWDRLRKDDGKVTADEVLAENYKLGSHHDGDRQLATAFSLLQLDDDPIPHLRRMMVEKKPERRAYAVLVAGMIGDSRLKSDIMRLDKDDARLGQFPGDWFWDTVADAAKEAILELNSGGISSVWASNGGKVTKWLTRPKPTSVDKRKESKS